MVGLLVLSLIVHYLADFTPLSTKYMLKCKSNFNSFKDIENLKGILLHSGVHGGLLFLVSIPFLGWYSLMFGVLNFITHTLIDCLKPLTTNLLVSKGIKANDISNVSFWMVFGADQLLHQMSILLTSLLLLV